MAEASAHFADRLLASVEQTSPLVAGIDPDFALMPPELQPGDRSPGAAGEALFRFAVQVLDATQGLVAMIKPQSAFFERHGSAGVVALARVIREARERGLLVLLDAKRGDIGSTATAYARAYLGGDSGSDLDADALTVNPLLGEDALEPFAEAARGHHRGLFVLVRTSNPGARLMFGEAGDPESGSARLARLVHQWGERDLGRGGYSSLAAVVGATAPGDARVLRELMPRTLFLMPGIGAQGGSVEAIASCFGSDGRGAIVPISRGLTYPDASEIQRLGFTGAVRERGLRYVEELQQALRRAGVA